MCGIAGIVRFEQSDPREERRRMLQMLGMIRHRGPDQFGIYQDATATLGSARLSIIDLGTGQQPIANEDGTLWVVFNGEIFNFVELRAELEERGHRFRTNSDTEVLLHVYEDDGAACLDRLNGQFAFAIWDSQRRQIFLARDRLGIRPLFYTRTASAFLFASEVKALLAHPGILAEIDPVALDEIFVCWTPLPGRTAFCGIDQLQPGHFLTGHDGEFEVKRYWSLSFPTCSRPARETGASEYLDEFGGLLTDATLLRLRSDVPVGAYLSGGLDSSILTALIASRTSNRLRTFSITFDDPQFDESEFQLRVSRCLGTAHEIVHITHSDIGRIFPEVVWHTETPITRTAPGPMFLLSKRVHDCGFKVVVTGEGADEFLAGYDIFKEAAIRRFWARRPESSSRPALFRRVYEDIPGLESAGAAFRTAFFRTGLGEVDSPHYSHIVRWRNNARTRRFFSDDLVARIGGAVSGDELPVRLPHAFDRWGALEKAQYLESTLFLSGYLLSSQGDRVAMAHSVESRMPFLDYRVVEFCSRLPADLKLRGLTDKYLLRRLGRDLLPAEVWRRPKRPYRAPIHRSFFSKPVSDYVRELLSPGQIKASGLFNPEAVARLVRKAENGMPLSETDDMALAGILSTQLVHAQFVTGLTLKTAVAEDRDDVRVCVGESKVGAS